MGTTTTTYADAVRTALDDLPAARYLELVDGLDEHLAEVHADADGSLADVLGPPEVYAAELRSSAGLPPRGGGRPAGAPLPPPVAPPTAVPERRPIDRGRLARIALAGAGLLAAWWVLIAGELTAPKLVLVVLGILGAMWLARRLLAAAALPDRTSRRVSTAIAVGGLVAAAAFGSAASDRRIYTAVYDGPPVTFATVPYRPDGLLPLPDFRGMIMQEALEMAASLGLAVTLQGGTADAIVMGQDPAPQTLVAPGASLVLSVLPLPATTMPAVTTTTVAVTEPTVASTPATTVAPTSAPASAAPTTATVATTSSSAATTTTVSPTTTVAAG